MIFSFVRADLRKSRTDMLKNNESDSHHSPTRIVHHANLGIDVRISNIGVNCDTTDNATEGTTSETRRDPKNCVRTEMVSRKIITMDRVKNFVLVMLAMIIHFTSSILVIALESSMLLMYNT